MKVVSSALLIAGINAHGAAALWGWGGDNGNNKDAAATVVVSEIVEPAAEYKKSGVADSTVATATSNRTLKEIINEERRFVVFNSRRLTGECLPICDEKSPTGSPTFIDFAETMEPTDSPTVNPTNKPTGVPTNKPTGAPTENPTARPTANPTATPTAKPTENPTSKPTATPTAKPTENPTGKPTATPTAKPTGHPTDEPVGTVPPGGTIDCDALVNLGHDFSKATGNNHYPDNKCYPPVTGANWNQAKTIGKDDSIAVFVGGNYNGVVAAEVEGRMVVLGNLSVKNNGPGNFVSVGVGTHVLPNSGTDCIMVGGNINAQRDIQVFNQADWMSCDIVYKGTATNINRWKNENGSNRHDPNLDLSHYEQMKDVFYTKSQFWKNLASTPDTRVYAKDGGTNFQCSNNDDIQVFNIQQGQRSLFTGSTWGYTFSNNCNGKTILINFQGTGNIKVNAVDLIWNGKRGYGKGGFPTCMTSSIMWNFPDAGNVEIGNQRSSEFQGSVLITGNMKMATTGHSGRTIVLGNLEHNKGGSEFHNYEFDPPKPLPEPDCDDYLNGLQPQAPTAPKPTPKPTDEPAPAPKPDNSSGGSPWGGTCKKTWDRCDGHGGDPNVCCDGLYCDDMGWGAQCKEDPNSTCLVDSLECTNTPGKCCNGLKCVGNEYYKKCQV